MKSNLGQLVQKYSACRAAEKEYEAGGCKYAVTRRFTGEKRLEDTVLKIAVARADRESL